jgi:hypothetical protein
MPTVNATRLTVKIALCLMTLCSTACSSSPPPVIDADIGCVRFKRIDVTQWQVDDMKKDPNQWRSLALQIKGHNDVYDKWCVDGDK